MTREVITHFLDKREALIATAAPGTGASRALADLTDEAVSALAGAASAGSGAPFAVFALGGYGARRLLPHSDIDLLVVVDPRAEDANALVRTLLYPLWDTGLQVGHQVRTPKGQARAVAEDLEILTSFLTARFVAGDETLAAETVRGTFRKIGKIAARSLLRFSARGRTGSPYLLEPDLKGGAGGQRDIDELVWRCALEAGAPVASCVALSLLAEGEPDALADAQDAVTDARWRLHRPAPRAMNELTVEDPLELGIDEARLQRALEVVHHTLLAVRDRAQGVRHRVTPVTQLAELARLAEAPDAVELLERHVYAAALEHAAPGFAELMSLRRPALSHRYTVGAHTIRALALAAHSAAFGAFTQMQQEALLVAALAHDLGKREPGPGHSERGAVLAQGIATRLGASDRAAAGAATLVREHLLLAETVRTRDLSDEDVVLSAAARIGDPALVAPLFELTAADMRATGPDVWTPWRATLVAELAAKLETALAPDTDGAGIVAAAEATRADALRRAAQVGASRSVLDFLEQVPLRYLARRTAHEVLSDARLVQSLAGPGLIGEVAFGVRPGPLDGTWLVDVVTRDRPGLFAAISGSLSLAGLSALSAEAFTERGGIALDTFTVASATLAPVEPAAWSAFERALHTALRDPAALDTRLAERRRHYPPKTNGSTVRTQVSISHSGPFTTGVRVRSADRVGLLHDLARAIELAGFDLRRATITTTTGVADDAFEVVDAEGNPPSPRDLAADLVPTLRELTKRQKGAQ